jgi:hypothetical protein
MNMPLMELLNYMTLIKSERAKRGDKLKAAAQHGWQSYMAALLEDRL